MLLMGGKVTLFFVYVSSSFLHKVLLCMCPRLSVVYWHHYNTHNCTFTVIGIHSTESLLLTFYKRKQQNGIFIIWSQLAIKQLNEKGKFGFLVKQFSLVVCNNICFYILRFYEVQYQQHSLNSEKLSCITSVFSLGRCRSASRSYIFNI